MMNRFGLVCLVIVMAAGSGFAQEKAALTDQCAFFWDVRMGTPEENAKYAEIIARSALISLEQKGFKPVPAGDLGTIIPALDKSLPLEETAVPQLLALAREQGSSFVILISYYKEDIFYFLDMRAWDQTKRLFFEFKDRTRSGLELYNRLNDATSELLVKAGSLEKVGPETDTTGEEKRRKGHVQEIVVLSGDDGCEIYLNGVMRVGVIIDGRLKLPFMPLKVGSKIKIEKRKEGYFPDTEEFALDDEWNELPLRPLERIVLHEGVFVYTLGQFVGFGLGYYFHIVPRQIYLGAENYFFLQTSDVVGSHTVIHNDLRILAGLYLISVPGVPIKVGLSTGLGCIFTILTIPDSPLFTDFYFNLLNIVVEFRLWQFVFFVREEMKLGLGIGNNLLGGDFFLIRGEIPIFSFGVKIVF